jgi:hypothetical protein
MISQRNYEKRWSSTRKGESEGDMATQTQYVIYTNEKDASAGGASGERVLVVRKCVECGDNLLGLPGEQYDGAQCEEGHHRDRPGVFYHNGQIIGIPDDEDGPAIRA